MTGTKKNGKRWRYASLPFFISETFHRRGKSHARVDGGLENGILIRRFLEWPLLGADFRTFTETFVQFKRWLFSDRGGGSRIPHLRPHDWSKTNMKRRKSRTTLVHPYPSPGLPPDVWIFIICEASSTGRAVNTSERVRFEPGRCKAAPEKKNVGVGRFTDVFSDRGRAQVVREGRVVGYGSRAWLQKQKVKKERPETRGARGPLQQGPPPLPGAAS